MTLLRRRGMAGRFADSCLTCGRGNASTSILCDVRAEPDSGGDGRSHAALPRVYRDPEGQPTPSHETALALEVDGERFDIRVVTDPATGCTDAAYTWLSGPNEGYGFSVSGPWDPSPEAHRQNVRDFLAMVDPTTGFIEDD